jgi:hypothetical protein
MSALPLKANMCGATSDVGYGPKAVIHPPSVTVIVGRGPPLLGAMGTGYKLSLPSTLASRRTTWKN